MNAVRCNNRNIRWNGLDARHVINRLAGLRIALGANYVGIGGEESIADFIEIDEVLFGPFYF